ncbi:hypothetical protein B0H11DRAFT_1997524 [Mycena galericulata]|nr:hypothetical protein B0H11DRAFT_1997524 [Mycena galericulata]
MKGMTTHSLPISQIISFPSFYGASAGTRTPLPMETIKNNPHLFKVATEIRTDRLRAMLGNHPNPAFINSVLATLDEGAWPFADTKHTEGFPLTWDNSRILPKTEHEREFLEMQSREEEELQRHSPPFGPELLPGMYSTPVLAVPKPHSTKLRLCSHMSAGPYWSSPRHASPLHSCPPQVPAEQPGQASGCF